MTDGAAMENGESVAAVATASGDSAARMTGQAGGGSGMIIRKAGDRGLADRGWLLSRHTFSFADYHDPEWMGYHSLRVINDDIVRGGGGFEMHGHRDMEIISFVLSGALRHGDSMGGTEVLGAGEAQRISAGSGIMHSEHNASETEAVHFIQIWIEPDRRGVAPDYARRSFAGAPSGRMHLIASGDGRDGSMRIRRDADLWLAVLEEGRVVTHAPGAGRHIWVQVAEGDAVVGGERFVEGDGLAFGASGAFALRATGPARVLVFDLE
jgi:redox-sensitive bicupin YhaK (pirin superfamily)